MNIVVVGYGAMGQRLVETIGVTEGVGLIGVVSKSAEIGVKSFDDLTQVPNVIIDFSSKEILDEMINYALKNNCALVIATTGYDNKDIIKIEAAAKSIPIVFTSNTSLGINMILELLKQIVPVLENDFDIEIIEKHHNLKLDSPSGTAKVLASEIANNMKTQPIITNGREGFNKRKSSEIGIHSLRGGTIPGEHSIIFAGDDEVIEIKHLAQSKKIFVNGAIKAAKYISNKNAGLYSMKDVLFKKGE